jgi:hypothetical protein
MVLCFSSLLLGAPFAYAWSQEVPTDNQPFPRFLRRLVICAAFIHVATIAYRLLRAVRAWEPLAPIVWRMLAAYALIGITFAIGIVMQLRGFGFLMELVLLLPLGWGCYLLGQAMTPGADENAA